MPSDADYTAMALPWMAEGPEKEAAKNMLTKQSIQEQGVVRAASRLGITQEECWKILLKREPEECETADDIADIIVIRKSLLKKKAAKRKKT
jgi:hypothetical protein